MMIIASGAASSALRASSGGVDSIVVIRRMCRTGTSVSEDQGHNLSRLYSNEPNAQRLCGSAHRGTRTLTQMARQVRHGTAVRLLRTDAAS